MEGYGLGIFLFAADKMITEYPKEYVPNKLTLSKTSTGSYVKKSVINSIPIFMGLFKYIQPLK